ncbi:MAG: hypothetical protein HOK20_05140, partial [Alphaproteobacteria bacterium]|nr:hypothetical protein [Alphaproteobacteria bacterium]
MSKISEEYLRDILRKIGDPYLKSDVITQNLVSHLSITPSENGLKITCILDVPSADAE